MLSLEKQLILTSSTTLTWGDKTYECRTGWGGIRQKKVEGDGATPIGTFPLRNVLYRPDRIRPFVSSLPITSLSPADGWCDDPTDAAYNRLIKLPYQGHHEILWREDHVYDIIIVVGYNDTPPIPAKGSAIFIHLMNEGKTPTEGCIALFRKDFIEILSDLTPTTELIIPNHLEYSVSLSSPSIQEYNA